MSKLLAIALALILCVTPILGVGGSTANAAAPAAEAPQYRTVVYYGEWSIYAGQKYFYPSKIDGSQITHLNFAFMDVDKQGNLVLCDEHADFMAILPEQSGITYGEPYAGVLGAMVILREKYPNMKIGISVGGWTRSGDFPAMAANATTRMNFANNVAKFVDYLGFDFVDIDWEYPTADRDPDPEGNGVTIDKGCKGSVADTKNFTYLMQDLRTALDTLGSKNGKYYELSCAMSANPSMMAKIEYDKVLETVDFANMMTYDLCGAWAPYTGHQTALYTNPAYDTVNQPDCNFSVDTCVKYLENTYGDKIDYSKIVIGVAPYTRGWAGVQNDGRDPQNPGLFATAAPNSVKAPDGTTSGTYASTDIPMLVSQYQLQEYYDEVAEACYYYSPTTGYFFTLDNERSTAAKAQYVKDKGLGGLISWMASLDAGNPIVRTMKNSLYGSAPLPAQKIVTTNPNVTATVSASGSTYTITIQNNEVLNESNTALKDAELFKETVTFPKLYIQTKSGAAFTSGSQAGTLSVQNGVNVLDLAGIYAAKSMKPGASHTFTVNVSGTADVADIASITMTQRILTSLNESAGQVIYGNGAVVTPEPTYTTPQPTQTKPTTAPTTAPTAPTTAPTEPQPTQTQPTEPQPTTGPVVGIPAWASGTTYKLGDMVVYQGTVYECTYPHTSHMGWLPSECFTLWKAHPEINPGDPVDPQPTEPQPTEPRPTEPKPTEPKPTEPKPTVTQPTEPEPTVQPPVRGDLPEHMVTGYWHNFCNGSANLRLSDVPSYYDMICVAFTGNTSTAGEVTFEIDKDLSNALGGYSEADFISDIKLLQSRGQHVIISVGGAEGRITINDQTSANKFASTLGNLIAHYGFEGVDIDLEGSAVSGVNYIAGALRQVHDRFGDSFIITMAPETFYVQADRLSANDITTSYLRLALEIKDILTVCYPQFYNSGSMFGYGGTLVAPGTADFLSSIATLIIEAGLRPDQVAIGVPSTSRAAGSGYVSNATIETAVKALVYKTSSGGFTAPRAYPTLRGVMTWSINWDATNNYSWAKAMHNLMASLPTGGTVEPQPTKPTDPTTKPTTAPTTEPTTKPTTKPTTEPTTAPTTQPTQPTNPGVGDTYSASKVYVGGDTVIYKGNTYKAQWWTQGEEPGVAMVWKLVGAAEPQPTNPQPTNPPQPGVEAYNASKVYTQGMQCSYNGHIWEARWWTQGAAPDGSAWGVWKQVG